MVKRLCLAHFNTHSQRVFSMTQRLKIQRSAQLSALTLTLSTLFFAGLSLMGCDPELTGELIDASVTEPEGGERPHGGDVQMGLADTPAPSVDCSGFEFAVPPSLESCEPFEGEFSPSIGATHVPEERIIYEQLPPTSGPHRPQWGRWGEYSWIPPERWLHNLEHGGVAFLYHPCAPTEVIEALQSYVRAYETEDGSDFRWILTPYEDMATPVAVVAWEWRALLSCFDEEAVNDFVARVYRQAPEDVRGDGAYSEGWIGR